MFTSTVVLGLWDQNHELAVQVFYRLTDDLGDVKKSRREKYWKQEVKEK